MSPGARVGQGSATSAAPRPSFTPLPASRWESVDLRRALTAVLLLAFFVGWVSFGFTLFDIGRFSITLQLVASLGLGLFVARFRGWTNPAAILLLSSGFLAWVVAATSVNHSARALTHVVQCGVGIGVAAAALSVRWEQYLPRVLRWCFALVLIVFAYEVYQFAARRFGLPGGFLPITNQQVGDDLGFQRGFGADSGSAMTRVSSFFPEPSDLGRFLLWTYCLASVAEKRSTRVLMLATSGLGILLSQSIGGVVGLVFLVAAMATVTLDLKRLGTLAVTAAVALWCFVQAFPDAVEAVMERWDRISTGGLAYLETTGRFADNTANLDLIAAAPWFGHGLGALKEVAPQNVVASNYLLLLIERGVLGTLLFLAPFLWAWTVLVLRGSRRDPLDLLALMLLTLELYLMVTFSALYFPPLYLALGFGVLRASRRPSRAVASPRARAVGQAPYAPGRGSGPGRRSPLAPVAAPLSAGSRP